MIRIITASIVALQLLASPVLAGTPCTDPHPMPRNMGALVSEPRIDRLPPSDVGDICGWNDEGTRPVFGCANYETNVITVTAERYLLNMGWNSVMVACLDKHEKAHLWHVNGTRWDGDHRTIVYR